MDKLIVEEKYYPKMKCPNCKKRQYFEMTKHYLQLHGACLSCDKNDCNPAEVVKRKLLTQEVVGFSYNIPTGLVRPLEVEES